MTETIAEILVRQDRISLEEAHEMVAEARRQVVAGEDPEEILYERFGLGSNYIWELI